MEAFTLLKYWHALFTGDTPFTAKIIPPAAANPYGDDGPYFDLEFSLSDQDNERAKDLQETESELSGDEDFSDSMDGGLEFVLKNDRQAPEETDGNRRVSTITLEGDETSEDHDNENDDLPSVGIQKVKGPLVCLFARENCSRANHGKDSASDSDSNSNSATRKGRLSKKVVHKYLKLLKPLYYVEKMKCSGQMNFPAGGGGADKSEVVAEGTRLKVVLKHLGKSRSSSALVAPSSLSLNRRSDDSLAELQEGVEGAILYCKRSYSMPAPAPGFDSD